jgi:hypothetical protein
MHLACAMFIVQNITRIKRLDGEKGRGKATQRLVILLLPLGRQEPRNAGPKGHVAHKLPRGLSLKTGSRAFTILPNNSA